MSARVGDTSRAVSANLYRLRDVAGLSLRQFSEELRERGVTITAQSLSAIERGRTAITVDLLTAFAAVLGVTPNVLLLPWSEDAFYPETQLYGTGPSYPRELHEWLTGKTPLGSPAVEDRNPESIKTFRERLLPDWLR